MKLLLTSQARPAKRKRSVRWLPQLVIGVFTAMLAVIATNTAAGAGYGSFTATYIACSYRIEAWDGYGQGGWYATGSTSSISSGCHAGQNVESQVRAYVSSGYYIYGPKNKGAGQAESAITTSSPIVFANARGRGLNASPLQWSSWSNWGA